MESVTNHIPILADIQEARRREKKQLLVTEHFEKRLQDKYGISFSAEKYPLWSNSRLPIVTPYVSSLLMLDMLDAMLQHANVQLPKEPSALDIGAGDWHYIHALHLLLQINSQSTDVHLDGVDILGREYKTSVNSRTKGIEGVTYSTGDFFDMPTVPDYDVIFAMHPLATQEVCSEWRIPYRPMDQFWKKAMAMLKPNGILFGCGYLFNEGASALNSFPKEERILAMHYFSPVRKIRGVDVSSIKGFDENVIMMARKPTETFSAEIR